MGRCLGGELLPDAVTYQDVQDLTDGGLLAGWFGQREMRLDLVPVAAAVFLLDDVSGYGPDDDDRPVVQHFPLVRLTRSRHITRRAARQ